MSPEKQKEFEELYLFIEYYSTHYLNIDRENRAHPSNCLDEAVKKTGKSKALQGLKQAVNDSIEDTADFDLEALKLFDSELSSKGIITLSALQQRYSSKYKRILKRGIIKNETEYYLVNGLLCDLDNGLPTEENAKLSKMIEEFEKNA